MEWFEGVVSARARVGGQEKWIVASESIRLKESEIRRELAFLGEVEDVDCL